jgi:hypothetical protein
MRLQAVQPPKAALTALKSMLGVHLSRAAEVDVSSYKRVKQVPVYVIDQAERISADDFDRLKPAAWRFVLFRNQQQQYATGDVTATANSYKLSMVTTSKARAQELLTGIHSAEDALQGRAPSDRFELRFLEAPAFQLGVLWLHDRATRNSVNDLFSVVSGTDRSQRLLSADNFIKLLNDERVAKLASRYLIEDDGPEALPDSAG